jgi:hypothetical protein
MGFSSLFHRSSSIVPWKIGEQIPSRGRGAVAEDGSLFLHFEACGDGPVLAVDFGQGGEVIACCETRGHL